MNDQDKIQNDIRIQAIAELTNVASEIGLPFSIEDDSFIVALPPEVIGQEEDPELD